MKQLFPLNLNQPIMKQKIITLIDQTQEKVLRLLFQSEIITHSSIGLISLMAKVAEFCSFSNSVQRYYIFVNCARKKCEFYEQ